MVRPDSTIIYDLAREHRRALMAEVEHDRLLRAARAAAVDTTSISTRRGLTAVWRQLCRAIGRVPATTRAERVTSPAAAQAKVEVASRW